MIRHLLKLAWNRKLRNALLLLELLVSFLIVTAVCVSVAHLLNNRRQPLGFTIGRVWSIGVSRNIGSETQTPDTEARDRATFRQMAAALKDMPEVEAKSEAMTGPYGTSNWGISLRLQDQRALQSSANRASDDYADVLGIHPVAGRWFQADDENINWQPVVLNRRFAEDIFGAVDVAVGRTIPEIVSADPVSQPGEVPALPSAYRRPKRVVGVVQDFRQYGELSTPERYMFTRLMLSDVPLAHPLPNEFLIRVKDGTPRAFEETLVKRLAAMAPGWSFEVAMVEDQRRVMNQIFTIPLLILVGIAGTLLLMVALGLTGVVWQSVTQRTSEFGLRRANGATAARVGRQVIGELITLTTIAIAVGCALVAQLLVLPLPEDVAIIRPPVFLIGLAVAIAVCYLVTILSSLYPSRLATRLPPAEALHYE